MNTFRATWGPLCDCLLTTPRQIVMWYDGPLRRLRLMYYPATRQLRLDLNTEARWLFRERYFWPDLPPAEISHRARAVLLAERDKLFAQGK